MKSIEVKGTARTIAAVSYTHLDVYKRQMMKILLKDYLKRL